MLNTVSEAIKHDMFEDFRTAILCESMVVTKETTLYGDRSIESALALCESVRAKVGVGVVIFFDELFLGSDNTLEILIRMDHGGEQLWARISESIVASMIEDLDEHAEKILNRLIYIKSMKMRVNGYENAGDWG